MKTFEFLTTESVVSIGTQWIPVDTFNRELKGLRKDLNMFILSEFHVVRTVRSTRSIEGDIFCFHVNQNVMLSDLSYQRPLYFQAYHITLSSAEETERVH
jgi:hypothetical protein